MFNELLERNEVSRHAIIVAECEKALDEERKKNGRLIEKAEKEYEAEKKILENSYIKTIKQIEADFLALRIEHPAEWLSWEDIYWEKSFNPPQKMISPPLCRLGKLKDINSFLNPFLSEVPALVKIITSKNLLINASGNFKYSAIEILQCVMLRLLVTIPPGKLKFILIDPVGLGSNMAGFMHLPEEIVGGKIWTEANHIEQVLADLSNHMEIIIQKYLRNDFPSMEDYNEKAEDIAEPYRFLVVTNFPINFSESTAQRLLNIANNGPRTGVYVIMMRDSEQKSPYNFRIDELSRLSTIIGLEKDHFVLEGENLGNHELIFDKLPPVHVFNNLLALIGKESKKSNIVQISFNSAIEATSNRWHLKSDDILNVPIGRAGARQLQYFTLGKSTLQHVLVAGKTGSGKSNLLHVIIMSLSIHYSPDEIELYLIDFKKGIEFKSYAMMKLPHARVIAIQSEREFGMSVLQGLDDEMQKRGDLFREAGVQNIKEYRQRNVSARMPRIVLLVDEFQEFFTEDDTIASHASLLLDRLVRQGRAFGIHAILASQALVGTASISRSTTDQMAIRIALQCSDADSRLVLGGDNPHAKLLSRPGEAIYNDKNGLIEGNSLFQVLFLSDSERDTYLKDIREFCSRSKREPTFRQIVFEGNAPADIKDNLQLQYLVDSASYTAEKSQYLAWIGEPIEIKKHTAVSFKKQSRSNMLVVGQNEELASAMLINSIISLAAQIKPGEVEFHILDFTKSESEWSEIVNFIPNILPHDIYIQNRRNAHKMIKDVHGRVERQMASTDNDKSIPLFLFIFGIQRARELRSTDGYTLSEQAELLVHIMANGPDFGIHTVCWCDTYKNIERIIGRNVQEFDFRVAMKMTVSESNDFIDTPDANKLEQYRCLLYDEGRTAHLEKFRPYSLASLKYIAEIGNKLNK